MLNRLEQRNREVWAGHSRTLADLTHVIGGAGIGLLLHPAMRRRSKPVGWSLVLLSTALHFYADVVKQRSMQPRQPAGLRDRVRQALRVA
jgi:hypothetical protein